VRVRLVEAHEGERLKAIRLRSLKADPDAFSSTYEREAAFPDELWAARAAQRGTFVAVDDEDRWLGIAVARDDDGTAVLNAMWVAPEARGQGAATALCDACAGWAQDHGFAALEVGVYAANEPARRTYAAAGFVPDREEGPLLVLKRALRS
jgi:GNAT superfamily N-acetyltransferase